MIKYLRTGVVTKSGSAKQLLEYILPGDFPMVFLSRWGRHATDVLWHGRIDGIENKLTAYKTALRLNNISFNHNGNSLTTWNNTRQPIELAFCVEDVAKLFDMSSPERDALVQEYVDMLRGTAPIRLRPK